MASVRWCLAHPGLFATGLYLAMSAFCWADAFQVESWTTERGLPDSSVTAIVQTPDGYLWIGTYNGVARFDGINFVTFDPENTPALAHARIRHLFLDRQGSLWINTFDGSLTRMKNGEFYREWTSKYQNDRDNTLVYSRPSAIAIVLDRGDIFKKDLSAAPGEGWTQLEIPNRNLLITKSMDGECLAWPNGQNERPGGKVMWRLVGDDFKPVSEVEQVKGKRIRSVAASKAGDYWLGTDMNLYHWDGKRFLEVPDADSQGEMDFSFLFPIADGSLWAIANDMPARYAGGRWTTLLPELKNHFPKLGQRFDMNADDSDGVWIHSLEGGLIHITAKGTVWQLNTETNGLNHRVTCFFTDREGNHWAGFELAGLARISEPRFQQPTLASDDVSRSMRSVCIDSTETVWFGSIGGGLIRYDQAGAIRYNFSGDAPRGSVFSCCADAQGRLWASVGSETLFVGQDGLFTEVSPSIHNVKAILAGRHSGKIWVGTRNGLFSSPDGGAPFVPVQEIGSKMVRALAEDIHGTVWCGADDGTLYRLYDKTVVAYHPDLTARNYPIWSLLSDEDGTIWVGTSRGGLLRFRDGKFSRFTRAQGLPDDIVSQILSDHSGNLWIGTHRGIARITRSSLEEVARGQRAEVELIAFGRADGLPSPECSGGYNPAAWRAEDGTLWFTTLKGAVSIQPATFKVNSLAPHVIIEQVLSTGRREWRPEATTKMVKVPAGEGQMEFHFAGLSLYAGERVKYSYRLLGEDADWVAAGARRFAHYASLRPGLYRFQVTASNADGVWNSRPAEFVFEVLPHVYERWWFRLLVVMATLGATGAIIRFIVHRRLLFRMQQLERQHAIERERTRIAKDIHDDLGANLNLIAVLGDLAKRDKTNERIDRLSNTARQTVKSLDEIVWAVNPRNDTLVNMIDYTCEFAVSYLRSAEIQCRHDLPESMPACEVAANVRHNFFLTTKEALQNIVKHSRATEVWLRVRTESGKLTMAIEDNGCGFENTTSAPWADGLNNIRQRLADIHGQCEIRSNVGHGTTILIELPFAALRRLRPDRKRD